LQGNKRGIPESAKWVRANEHESLLVHESRVEPSSGDEKTEGSRKGFWYPKELDRDIWRSWSANIARQALGPGETVRCSFCARKQPNWWRLSWRSCFSEFNVNALVSQEFHHLSPVEASRPVSPYNGMTSGWWSWGRIDLLGRAARPEHSADAARFLRYR